MAAGSGSVFAALGKRVKKAASDHASGSYGSQQKATAIKEYRKPGESGKSGSGSGDAVSSAIGQAGKKLKKYISGKSG